MVMIKPFKGITPNPIYARYIASLPYDVMNFEEAKSIVANNQKSFLRVEKSEVDFDSEISISSDLIFKKAAENLNQMLDSDILHQDSIPNLYIYQQQMGEHIQTGLVCCSSINDYNNDIIKKHEFTRKDKEDERASHINIANANTGPVFLVYPHKKTLDAITDKITSGMPHINFVSDDNVRHTLWKISDSKLISKIESIFQNMPSTYIADGHHRAAAASRVQKIRMSANTSHTGNEEYNFFLTVLFPDSHVKIMDYNRVLKDLNGMTEKDLLSKLSSKFKIQKLDIANPEDAKPTKQKQFSMFLGNIWYHLDIKKKLIPKDPVNSLDASILQNEVLSPFFGIDDPRTNKRIDFIGGIRGLEELEKRCEIDCKVAFALHPVSINQIIKVANSGSVMPPKSTWFEPKLRSGMVIHKLSD